MALPKVPVLVAMLLLGLWFGEGFADVPAPKPSKPSVTISPRLIEIFSGDSPRDATELRKVQSHVQELTKKIIGATVGVQIEKAQGSGVIISEDGYVLTAAHVIGRPNAPADFMLPDGRLVRGVTLGLNRSVDAGLMKITDPGPFPFAPLANSDEVSERQWCLVTGHPGGFQADRKAVLRMGQILLRDSGTLYSNCPLVGGDSGGPIFDMDGRVIGINSRISQPITSNMHVPVNQFVSSWTRLVNGEAWGALPGEESQPAPEAEAATPKKAGAPYVGITGNKRASGASVEKVKAGSPAARAGIEPGDVITRFDDKPVATFDEFLALVRESKPGQKVIMTIDRKQETKRVSVTIGKRPE